MTKYLAAMLMAMILGGCASARRPDFVVTRDPVGPPIVGFGACMNPYVYAYPNWPAEINEGNVGRLESEVKDLHPQFVRVFFLNSWWEDDTDPVIAKGHPGMRASVVRTIRLAQDAGAKVLLQFWYDPKRYADPEGVSRRFASAVAEMRGKYGLTAVRYVTMQNEPNDDGKDVTKEQYVSLYRGLDRAMKDLGIRQDVQIVGGDLLSPHQAEWFAFIGRELSPVLDGYSIHAYWAYWDSAKLVKRVRDTRRDVDALPAAQRRPVFVTEFGVQGKRPNPQVEPGTYADGRPLGDVPAAQAQVAWFVMEAINAGFVGTSQWDMYDAWYDRKMGYGVIGNVEEGIKEKPGYGLLRLFTTGVRPGWTALRVEGGQPDVIVAAVGLDGHRALYVLNHGKTARRITLAGLDGVEPLRRQVWNGNGDGAIVRTSGVGRPGTVTLDVQPESLEVFSE